MVMRGHEVVYLVAVGRLTFEAGPDRDGVLRCRFCDARGADGSSCRHVDAAIDHIMTLADQPCPVVDRERLADAANHIGKLAAYLTMVAQSNPPIHRPALDEAARYAARLVVALENLANIRDT